MDKDHIPKILLNKKIFVQPGLPDFVKREFSYFQHYYIIGNEDIKVTLWNETVTVNTPWEQVFEVIKNQEVIDEMLFNLNEILNIRYLKLMGRK